MEHIRAKKIAGFTFQTQMINMTLKKLCAHKEGNLNFHLPWCSWKTRFVMPKLHVCFAGLAIVAFLATVYA